MSKISKLIHPPKHVNMREERQHRETQSRVIQRIKKESLGIPMVDNRDTPQTRLMDAIQRMGMEEEDESLQMKSIVQLQSEDEEPLQGKFENIQQKPNNTGLPDNLKSGVENMSGFSMDDVRVHYNSDKPAQMQAHAYAQGTDIHIAPGQEKHLPHETWHVVQQKQGRVRPTMQMQGVGVNNDTALEKEADVMGRKANSLNSPIVQTQYPLQLMRVIQMEPGEELAQILDIVKKPEQHDEIMKISNDAHDVKAEYFVEKQKTYQNYLVTLGLTVAQIMNFHKSAGYEFEFASFYIPEKPEGEEHLPSHMKLAKSEILNAYIFNLPFLLETDSDNSLELVTPPFLFLSSFISSNILVATFDKYTAIFNHLNGNLPDGKEKVVSLNDLIANFPKNGFGNNWEEATSETILPIKNAKHSSTYGQANVSMTANEIVEILIKLSKRRDGMEDMSTLADRSHSGDVFNKIYTLLIKECKYPNEEGAILLYSRFASNLLGIPSLLFRRETDAKPTQNFATEIKETLGIWIKAQPHVVILDYIYNKSFKNEFNQIIESTKQDVFKIILTEIKIILTENGSFSKDIDSTLSKKMTVKNDRELKIIQAMEKAKRMAPYLELIALRKEWISENEKEKGKLLAFFEEIPGIIEKELSEFIDLIYNESPLLLKFPKPAPFKEDFGDGTGVRKETFIPPVSTEKGVSYVGEVRGRAELELFGLPNLNRTKS